MQLTNFLATVEDKPDSLNIYGQPALGIGLIATLGELRKLAPGDPDPRPISGEPVGNWHWWFAWRPVRTYDQRLVWLKRIRRRCIQKHQYLYGASNDFWWQYHCDELPTTNEPNMASGRNETRRDSDAIP